MSDITRGEQVSGSYWKKDDGTLEAEASSWARRRWNRRHRKRKAPADQLRRFSQTLIR
jgi:hypothetical protein